MHTRTTIAAACSAALFFIASVIPASAQGVPVLPNEFVAAPGPCDPNGSVPAGYNVINGNAGADVLVGTPGKDILFGRGGNDYLFGNEGDDIICAGDGDDIAYGGPGRDRIWGGENNDKLYGESGNDDLFGQNGSDQLDGGSHTTKDFCQGGNGIDAVAACETVLP
jgi:Ca2+-binding RTX toxin-like protein